MALAKTKGKKKGPTPKKRVVVIVKCEGCGNEEPYPCFGDCKKCAFNYAVYATQ